MPVLVLTDASGVTEALQAGASAVLSECADSILSAPQSGHRARPSYAVGEFRDHLVDASGSGSALESDAEDEPPPIELTLRELQVLRLLAEGASNKSIARRLGITPHTAKFHVASIVAKLGATGRTDGGQSHAFGAHHDLKSCAPHPGLMRVPANSPAWLGSASASKLSLELPPTPGSSAGPRRDHAAIETRPVRYAADPVDLSCQGELSDRPCAEAKDLSPAASSRPKMKWPPSGQRG